MAEHFKELLEMPMNHLIEQVLPFRSPAYLESFYDKLLAQGIVSPQDLLGTTMAALEMKLSTHGSFNFIEMADTISLRNAVQPEQKKVEACTRRRSSEMRVQRSRSAKNRGFKNDRGRQRSGISRCHRIRKTSPLRQCSPSKPLLWKAVERNDIALVEDLLKLDHDVEEKIQGWTPLMKAAEENRTEILKLLIEKGADINAQNKKGRSALSFAAAPSMQRKTSKETLRILLSKGADSTMKCARELTPKAYALKEKRDDAVKILEEFE